MNSNRLSVSRQGQDHGVGRHLDQLGAVFLEFTYVVVGILFGTILFYDIGELLLSHLTLSQIVSEGVKTGCRTPELETGVYQNIDRLATLRANCSDSTSISTGPCAHLFVQERVRFLLENMAPNIDLAATTIETEYRLIADSPGQPDATVIVEIQARYSGYLIPAFSFGVIAEGPYLFRD